MKHFVPQAGGPWSWRRFSDGESARQFHCRLSRDHPAPVELTEPHVAPDGSVLPAGTWVVIYRPIICDDVGAS